MQFNKHTLLLLASVTAIAIMIAGDPSAHASQTANTPNVSASVRRGSAISAQCAMCHGSNGISVAGNIPNLAGQRYGYLLQQLRAFKHRKRRNPLMDEVAHSLTRQQMKDLSAYFASIPLRVGQPAAHG